MEILSKPWKKNQPPKRILIIRLQATGDVVITLPYIQHLRNHLPEGTIIDFLTREETSAIPKAIILFDRVYEIGGGRNFKKQVLHALLLLPSLMLENYDVIIDLQNNLISRVVLKVLRPKAWASFDRYSANAAGERNRRTIEALNLGSTGCDFSLKLKADTGIGQLLEKNGLQQGAEFIVLNPAGAFENRNWPLDNYLEFARHWAALYPDTQFVIAGVDKIAGKAAALEEGLRSRLVNLVNKTTAAEAFAIVQKAKFVLSEDSGLMHMAWVSGIPTLAIFGATRSDWSRPLGGHTDFLDSSDLACGNCMSAQCILEEERTNHCMTRLSAAMVFEKAITLLHHTEPLAEVSG